MCRRHKKKQRIGHKVAPQISSHRQDRLYLGYDHICQGFRESEELSCAFQFQCTVVLYIILDAVVDIGDLANIVTATLHAKISLQLTPALQHQFQSLTVVQLQV